MIPGLVLHRVAAGICSPKQLERVVEPAIADLQKEYGAAESGSVLRRARVLFTGYLAILEVMLMCALQTPPATDEERRALVRTFAWTAGIVAGVGALMIGLVVATVMMGGAPWPRPVHYAMLIPMALPIALPIAMTFGLAIGFGGRAATGRAKRTIVATAFMASLVSLVSLWTIAPLANQAFRQATFEAKGGRGDVMKVGAAEMTMPELRHQANALSRNPRQAELARMGRWNFHMRVALSFGTLVLALFSLAVAERLPKPPRAMVMAGSAVYLLLLLAGEALTLEGAPPAVAAWLANAVFLGITAYLSLTRPSKIDASLRLA
jgi:hypothetical protein